MVRVRNPGPESSEISFHWYIRPQGEILKLKVEKDRH